MNNYGRKVIETTATEITEANVVEIVNKAIGIHTDNQKDINYLYNRYKGDSPIYQRTKAVRNDICNKIAINHCNETVSFKTGYLVGEPIQYVSRSGDSDASEKISLLNSMMLSQSKASKDEDLADWIHICGVGYRIVLASREEESPFEIYTLDPRETFVIRSTEVGNRILAGVCMVTDDDGTVIFTVYTKDSVFTLKSGEILKTEKNTVGIVPIVEYTSGKARLGSFEVGLPILDAIERIESNRLDGIEQFIGALAVATNCSFEEGVTAQTIMEAGMICLKSTNEQKASFDILAKTLDQTSTQTLVDDLYHTYLSVVGMPSQGNGNTSDSSNNGAALIKNGWTGAETRAKRAEVTWRESEDEMLKIVLKICRETQSIDLRTYEILIKFTRRNYEDLASKATVFATLINTGYVTPEDCFSISGLVYDPTECAKRGLAWHESVAEEQAEEATANEQAKEATEDEQI